MEEKRISRGIQIREEAKVRILINLTFSVSNVRNSSILQVNTRVKRLNRKRNTLQILCKMKMIKYYKG